MCLTMEAPPAVAPARALDWIRDGSEYCAFCLSMYCRELDWSCTDGDLQVCSFCVAWLDESEAQCSPCAPGPEGF